MDLLEPLDLVELDIEQSMHALTRDVSLVVPSCVGFSMTILVGGEAVTVTSMAADAEAGPITSSLALPLNLTDDLEPGSRLVLYAHAPGAFVDLAADLSYALGARAGLLTLDDHLHPSACSGIAGVEQLSIVNRAVGMLVGRGHSVIGAQEWLERNAVRSGLEVYQVAAYLVGLSE